MNKKLLYPTIAIFIINIIVLLFSLFYLEEGSIARLMACLLIGVWLLIFTVNNFIKNKPILENKFYTYLLLAVNIMVAIIIIRNFFDPMIPLKSLNFSSGSKGFGVFLNYNLLYISIMYASLLIYTLINNDERKKTKKK